MPSRERRDKKRHTWIYVVVIGGLHQSDYFFWVVTAREAGRCRRSISNKSIAVLPFDNLSRDPDNAYFAEGVQDEILTRLAKVADLKVFRAHRHSIFKSAPAIFPEIAKQLA